MLQKWHGFPRPRGRRTACDPQLQGFEKVKLYEARHLVEMTVARSGMRPLLSAIAGRALPNNHMFAVSTVAAQVLLVLQSVAPPISSSMSPQGQSRGTKLQIIMRHSSCDEPAERAGHPDDARRQVAASVARVLKRA
jgi:hypothetical protein